ncbi:hypothetical protein KGP23_10555 [Serratia ureilytica]|uniref:hypothetical protein n=1 Tax=Serratia ureilytica TaxID=300181 RepID=UPI001CC02F5B|nr:hypothetical protein [Serratia ureilytica]UAN29229.1 hypothetical protein KGP23_10555 [Serratia ureilytica]
MFGENNHSTASAQRVKNKELLFFNNIKVGTGFDYLFGQAVPLNAALQTPSEPRGSELWVFFLVLPTS